MAWEDYIPNIFGAGMPQYLPGLLGDKEAAELQNRAKVQGLLGAGLALAQGMSSAGPRRSAAQNILGALAGGVSAGQGAYQGATQNYLMQQKIAESMLEREKAQNQIASQKEFFARYPHLRGIYGASPAEAAKVAGEEEAWRQIDEAYKGGDTPQVAPQTQVAAQTQIPQDGTQQIAPSETPNVELGTKENQRLLGAVPVETSGIPPEVSNLLNQKQYLLGVNKRLTGKRGGSAEIDKNLKIIEGLDKQIGAYTVANYDFADIRSKLPSEFQGAAQQLESLAYSGSISPKDLVVEVNKLQKDARDFKQKQLDFAVEANRLAFKQFKKPLNELSPEEVGWVDAEIQRKDLAGKKAGAASVNVAVTGEKKMAEKRAEGAVKAEDAAFSAMSAAGDVRAIVDILKPYRGGPIQSFQAQIGAYFPGTAAEKLASASQVAEAIRQRIAPTIRVDGSGATSDFDARSYLNAIPNLMNTAEGRELMAKYAEKLANRAAAAADIRARMVSEGDFSVRRFQEELKKQGLMQVFTPEELKILRGDSTVRANTAIAPGVTVRRVK